MAFPTKPLSECARLSSGGTPSKSNPAFWGGPIAWLTPKDMSRFDGNTQDSVTRDAIGNGTREASEDSLFIAVRGMSLHNEIRVVRPKRKMAFNQDIKAITPVAAVDGRFLHYALLAKIPELLDAVEAAGHGTGVLPTDKLNSLSIPDLALPEQRAIAATLGALDDKIELNRKMNATLESMARALFRDWFVDFGPTRAKMEGREPYHSPDLWALFPDRLDDEGKPEGWEVSTVGAAIELFDRKRVPLSSQERAKRQGPFPYHGATSVMDHVDGFLFDEKLLLLGEDGSVAQADGRPFTQYVWGKLWVNNHAHVIKGREISVEQLKLFFDQVDIRPFVTGAVQPKLNQANLKRVPFLRASGEVHSSFDAVIAPLFDLIRHRLEESRPLAQTRDLLLPRLMSGELRVSDLDTDQTERVA